MMNLGILQKIIYNMHVKTWIFNLKSTFPQFPQSPDQNMAASPIIIFLCINHSAIIWIVYYRKVTQNAVFYFQDRHDISLFLTHNKLENYTKKLKTS